jgi:hypothetical protein
MDRKLSYSAFAALIVAAGAFGVHVGESAISQINPLYFQGAAVHPRDRGVVVDESALVERGPRFAQLYGWEQGGEARSTDCGDCDALAARDAYAGASVRLASAETGWQRQARPAAYAPAAEDALTPIEEEPEPFETRRAEVVRYASYAIEAAPDPAQPPIDAGGAQE